MTLTPALAERLTCPACNSRIALGADRADCASCGRCYPVRNGVPLLVDESSCILTHDEIVQSSNAFNRPRGRLERFMRRVVPSPNLNVTGPRLRRRFAALVGEISREPVILRVGNGEDAVSFDDLPAAHIVSSDLFLYPGTDVSCDAQRIPFADGTFDGVTIIAVLEHVTDPERAVAEIHRVLKPGGLVLAETPFMQQVHGGAFDFTRFTDLGHRRLFRRFEEVERGACCGPGMALAWAYRYFLVSLVGGSARTRQVVTAFAYLTSFWLRWFDKSLIARPESRDAASGLYFLGRRSDATVGDRALVREYRGAGAA